MTLLIKLEEIRKHGSLTKENHSNILLSNVILQKVLSYLKTQITYNQYIIII
jgi:hypothetical protein